MMLKTDLEGHLVSQNKQPDAIYAKSTVKPLNFSVPFIPRNLQLSVSCKKFKATKNGRCSCTSDKIQQFNDTNF